MLARSPRSSHTALLSVESLNVSIGEVAVIRNLSLRVAAGEVLGLVGASGSGKSMTALAVMRLLPARARLSGSMRLRGADIGTMADSDLRAMRGRDVGMVFQEPMTALNPLMRVGDQVAETVRLHGAASRARAQVLAREALASVGLQDDPTLGDRYPHELSGGQRQRGCDCHRGGVASCAAHRRRTDDGIGCEHASSGSGAPA